VTTMIHPGRLPRGRARYHGRRVRRQTAAALGNTVGGHGYYVPDRDSGRRKQTLSGARSRRTGAKPSAKVTAGTFLPSPCQGYTRL